MTERLSRQVKDLDMAFPAPQDPEVSGTSTRAVLPVEPSARTYTLADLMNRVRAGRVRVPHFQRGLRWAKSDAAALVDSVLRGFPIGSLLLWKRRAPAEIIRLGDVTIDAPKMDEALYVVDGQQRITAFLNAFDPKAGINGQFALVYDLKEFPFQVRPRRAVERDSIPLPTLFDLGRLLRWTSENPQYVDLIDTINEATTRLREFHVPAYEVSSNDDSALRVIYDRMNNAGKRLSRAEAFWGLFAPNEGAADDLMSLSTLQDHVATGLHWGRIDDDTILRVFLARRGHDVNRDIHQEFDDERRQHTDFPGESKQEAYHEALVALERTVLFLRESAGVPHFTFLAFRYLLVVLARFFAHFPEPDPRNLALLRRWYWRAALIGPSVAKGSATGAMRLLSGCVRPGDETESVQALMHSVEKENLHMHPDVRNFRSNYSATHLMLCALWDRGPRNPDSGELFNIMDLADEIGSSSTPNSACPELFFRSSLPKDLQSSIGNRILLPGVPVEIIRSLVGDSLFPDRLSDTVRNSHLLLKSEETPVGADFGGQYVRLRTQSAEKVVNDFISRMVGEGLDDAPPLSYLEHDEDDDNDENGDAEGDRRGSRS